MKGTSKNLYEKVLLPFPRRQESSVCRCFQGLDPCFRRDDKRKKEVFRGALLIFAFCVLFFSSCTPKDRGFISLVNSNVTPITISVDNRDFTVFPSNHITKEIGEGMHKIKVDSGAPISVQITRDKTTLFDSTGLSCFVVADFTDRYNGGNVKIVERFFHERVFTTNDEMITLLGSYLPKKLTKGKRALRIQQVDCETVNDDSELATSLVHAL